jgi:hypothetical protein
MFDIAAPPGGITCGANAFLFPASLATDTTGAKVMLLEYGTTVTGGPSAYYSSDSGATWTKVKTFTDAKHAHAVKFINGLFWATFGDAGFAGLGLYSCDPAAPTVWTRRSIYGEGSGGNTLYGIGMFPLTYNGRTVIVIESDSATNVGPLIFPSTATSGQRAMLPTVTLPPFSSGTMRQLTLDTATGNLFWFQSSESSQLNTVDAIWMMPPPYTAAVLLEEITVNNIARGNPVIYGDYFWLGADRCHIEKMIGQ